jgi:hypothetical protein
MGVNFGAGLYSLLASFFSLAAGCCGATVSSAEGSGAGVAVASSEFAGVASSEFLASLPASEFLENAGVMSMKIKVNRAIQRAVSRSMRKTPRNYFLDLEDL